MSRPPSRRDALRAALLLGGAAVVAGACRDRRGSSEPRSAEDDRAGEVQPAGPLAGVAIPTMPAEATPEAAAEVAPTSPPLPAPSEGAQLARLVIPKAKVNHRFVVRGLTARREMEDPGGKDDVAWYTFSALPGRGSNAVISGHVDWYTGEAGVFWYLRNLKDGDDAEVHYTDGLVLQYRVGSIQVFGTNDAPVAEITGPTVTDTLTLITCDGVFSKSSKDYNQRRVVRADRVA